MRGLLYYWHMFRKIFAIAALLLMVSAAAVAMTYRYLDQRYQLLLTAHQDDFELRMATLDSELQSCLDNGTGMGSGQLLSDTCPPFNADEPDAAVEYRDESHGIAVQLPYNAHWGFGMSVPEGYQELSGIDGILFGRPTVVDQCRWAHTGQLTFLPARSAEAIAEDVATRLGFSDGEAPSDVFVTQIPLEGHMYYSYELPGFCLMKNFELIGERYNYIFSSCAEYSEDLLAALVSVELL